MRYKLIPVSEISVDNGYRISLKREKPFLNESIGKYGLKTPVSIVKEDSGYLLITGYKRYDIIKKLNMDKIECRLIEKPLSDCQKILFNIDDNLATDGLSLYEKINALIKLRNNGCEKFTEYISLLKIDPSLIEEIDFSRLPYEILTMIDNGDFDKKILSYFKYFNKEQINLLTKYFIKLQFTKSEKRKFMDNLLRADEMGTDITKFLQNNINYEKPRIIKEIIKIINPQTEKLKENFLKIQKQFRGVKLSAEPYFEDPNLKLEIKFKDFECLKKKLEKLNKLIKDKTGSWYED